MLVLVHSLFPLALDGSHLEAADARVERDEPALHLAFHRELDSAKFCDERTDGESSGNAAIVVYEPAGETDVDEDAAAGGGLSGGVRLRGRRRRRRRRRSGRFRDRLHGG